MAYSNSTKFFNIPYMGRGDLMTEEDNDIQMSVIDGILYSFGFAHGNCLVREGNYIVEYDVKENKYGVRMEPSGDSEGYSLCGVLNRRLFCAYGGFKVVSGLSPNTDYLVYLSYSEGMDTNPAAFDCVAYESNEISHDIDDDPKSMRLLKLSTYRTDSQEPGAYSIDITEGKKYSKSLYAHVESSSNPHGHSLQQDVLNVTERLSLHGSPLNGCEYGSVTGMGPEQDVIYSLASKNGMAKFVSACPESVSAGMVACFISSDGRKITLRNSGEQDQKINLRIDLEY